MYLITLFQMQNIINRLKRLEGQISGLQKMISKNEDCQKVIIQFQAAKAALESTFSEVLNTKLEHCISEKNNDEMKKIIKLITK